MNANIMSSSQSNATSVNKINECAKSPELSDLLDIVLINWSSIVDNLNVAANQLYQQASVYVK